MKNDHKKPKTHNNNKNRPVNISTKNVVVNPTKAAAKSRPNKRQRNKARNLPGTETGLSVGPHGGSEPIPDAAAAFIETYVDPCGEHQQSLDAGRAPDGVLQTSCALFFRYIETISLPFQTSGTTDLSGKTYSMLVLQFPFLRNMSILVVRKNDGEFDDALMAQFCKAFASITRDIEVVAYPNWTAFTNTDYFTLLDTAAMRSIIPPSPDNGVSTTIDSYRFTSQGFELLFNTPDLINQGTLVSMRYPVDLSSHTIIGDREADALPVFLQANATLQVNTANFAINIGQVTAVFNGNLVTVLPGFVGFSTSLPGPNFVIPSNVIIRRPGGVQWASAGQTIRYQLNATNSRRLELQNLSTNQQVSVLLVLGENPGQQTNEVTEFFIEGPNSGLVESEGDGTITTLTLPPVSQNAMLQANPKSACQLLKEFDGIYLPSAIMQPVMTVTHSSSYRKCCIINKDVDLRDPEFMPFNFGWYDTLDQNFTVGVANFQGIPLACKPLLKICRTIEAVPASDSILGAVTTGCPEKCPEALDVCQAFTELQPHGFPVQFNGLGILFSKVSTMINRMNVLYRDSRNISREVNNACQATWQAAKTVRGTYHALRQI